MTMLTVADLHGPALTLYETLRARGRSQQQAIDEVIRAGLVQERRTIQESSGPLTVAGLHGPARRLFEDWRALGKTEAQALEEVRRSGVVEAMAAAGVKPASEVTAEDFDRSIAADFGLVGTAMTSGIGGLVGTAMTGEQVTEADFTKSVVADFGITVKEA